MATTLDVEPADYIYLDLFPSQVTGGALDPDTDGNELRTIATDNYLYVIIDRPSGPELLLKEPLTAFEGSRRSGYTIGTTFNTYYIEKAPNCGCGSRLRSLHPFMGVPFVRKTK